MEAAGPAQIPEKTVRASAVLTLLRENFAGASFEPKQVTALYFDTKRDDLKASRNDKIYKCLNRLVELGWVEKPGLECFYRLTNDRTGDARPRDGAF